MQTKLEDKDTHSPKGMLKNSAWGVGSNMLQIVFVSLFFAIVARRYGTSQFAQFLIANTIYQLVASFSSMGLGQWFIRKYLDEADQIAFTGKFFKTQLALGVVFYLINILLAYTIYPDGAIRLLAILLGTNIIFDNIIAAVKSLNIVEARQDKTAFIVAIDGFLKLVAGCLLFIHPFSIATLAVLMIAARLITLGLFISTQSSLRNWISIIKTKISLADWKTIVLKNWRFMIIGSVSIIYWRVGNLIISKTLSLTNVAEYELAFRIFSIFQILPVIASATIYPRFIKYVNENNQAGLRQFYTFVFYGYTILAVLAYAFIYTFAPIIIPIAFGDGYPNAAYCLQHMFLAFLIMPTVLLQANLIVALGLEQRDMQFNMVSLVINVAGCFIGIYLYHSLNAVNYSIFGSLVIFHLLQDIVLIKRKLIDFKHCLLFYSFVALVVMGFLLGSSTVGIYTFYSLFTVLIILIALGIFAVNKNKFSNIIGKITLSKNTL